jgi:hypothetical protein
VEPAHLIIKLQRKEKEKEAYMVTETWRLLLSMILYLEITKVIKDSPEPEMNVDSNSSRWCKTYHRTIK